MSRDGDRHSVYHGSSLDEGKNAKVKIKAGKNFQGNRDAKIRLKKKSGAKQFTNKRNGNNDNSYAHDEEVNGTETERKNAVIKRKMAKKYGVPASAADGQQQGGDGGMMGGMM